MLGPITNYLLSLKGARLLTRLESCLVRILADEDCTEDILKE